MKIFTLLAHFTKHFFFYRHFFQACIYFSGKNAYDQIDHCFIVIIKAINYGKRFIKL